ncbi:hypothetical protein ACWJJH_04895 [Endozoicomonadaceae bacterium StTr2]
MANNPVSRYSGPPQPVIDELKTQGGKPKKHKPKKEGSWLGRRIKMARKNANSGYLGGTSRGFKWVMFGNSSYQPGFNMDTMKKLTARAVLFVPACGIGLLRGIAEGTFGVLKGLVTAQPHRPEWQSRDY